MNKRALILACAALVAGPALSADPAAINWSKIPVVKVPLFYPGQSSYEWLRSDAHKGASKYLAQLRVLLFAGRQKEAEALAMREFMSIPVRQHAYQSFGDVMIDFGGISIR